MGKLKYKLDTLAEKYIKYQEQWRVDVQDFHVIHSRSESKTIGLLSMDISINKMKEISILDHQ